MIKPTTQQQVKAELNAAHQALKDAELLVKEERLESSISRAYYAVYHAARAALQAHGSNPTTHKGVKSEFGRLFVKTGKIEDDYNTILQELRDQRQVADYETNEREFLLNIEFAKDIVTKAKKFINCIEDII